MKGIQADRQELKAFKDIGRNYWDLRIQAGLIGIQEQAGKKGIQAVRQE